MEFYGGRQKYLRHFIMQCKRCWNDMSTDFCYGWIELLLRIDEMCRKNRMINGCQWLGVRKIYGKYTKVTLQTRINCEAAARRIHACHILTVMYVFQRKTIAIIPMAIILWEKKKKEKRIWMINYWFNDYFVPCAVESACAVVRCHMCPLRAYSYRQWSKSSFCLLEDQNYDLKHTCTSYELLLIELFHLFQLMLIITRFLFQRFF